MYDEQLANVDSSLETLESEISKIRETSMFVPTSKYPTRANSMCLLTPAVKSYKDRRQLLLASLISSKDTSQTIENGLKKVGIRKLSSEKQKEVRDLISEARKHRDTNYHRLAFSTTLFPWKDPNPYNESPNLLGLRIDACMRDGTFAKPYYVLFQRRKQNSGRPSELRKDKQESTFLSIYRHTIPAFIPMDKLASRYLPQSKHSAKGTIDDDGIEALGSTTRTPRQDVTAFARHLRKEISAWHARRDAISWLQEQLGMTDGSTISRDRDGLGGQPNLLVSLAATSLESRYVRLEWADGRVGRFKISNSGIVERAVVIGEQGRDKQTESKLTGGNRRVESLVTRLSTT